jgi:subtilisin family serine protease
MIDDIRLLKNIKTYLPIVCLDDFVDNQNSQIIDWGIRQNKIPETWKSSKGEGIKIAVIDTGHVFHEDIGDNSIIGENFIDNEPMEDLNGHQSHCTGIICAKNNTFGMVGVAPKAQCISIKALGKNGSGTFRGLVKALDYAIKIKPDIVSMSLGAPQPNSLIHDKIKQLYAMNIPVVCAAGNSGNRGVNWPAAYAETIAVAAYNKQGEISNFSSRGEQLDWAAPGEKIYSTYLKNSYAVLSGTSMACPFVAGIIALMLSKHKRQEKETGQNDCKTIKQILEHLKKYTLDRGEKGKDSDWGYGIININKLIQDYDKTQPPGPNPPHDPKPKPEPKPVPGFLKRNLAWVVFGAFIFISITIYAVSVIKNKDNNQIPYVDEKGNVDWDKKFELEKNENRELD